jgi:hypothetical protein
MSSSRALAIVAVIGVAIFALSFVNGWIVHDRELRGEGYRHSEILLSAWRSVAMPVLGLGVLVLLATAIGATTRLAGLATVPGWLLGGGAVAGLALIASSLAPIGWDGDTMSIDLRPAVLTWAGIGLAAIMVAGIAVAFPPTRRGWVILGALGAVLLVAGVGGRQLVLTVAGPSNQNWSDGTYVLDAGGDAVTLVIEDGRYRIDDRWAGAWEGTAGWTIALDHDPTCPGSRGAYHAHAAGDDELDLRFVMIVDSCEEGARAELLESGIWERQE